MIWDKVPITGASSTADRDITDRDFLRQFVYAIKQLGLSMSTTVDEGDYPFRVSDSAAPYSFLNLRDKGKIGSDGSGRLMDPYYKFGKYNEMADGVVLPSAERTRDYLYSFSSADVYNGNATDYMVDAINDVLTANSLDNIDDTLPPATGKIPWTRKYGDSSSPTVAAGNAAAGDIMGPWVFNEWWALLTACTHSIMRDAGSISISRFRAGSTGAVPDCATALSNSATDLLADTWNTPRTQYGELTALKMGSTGSWSWLLNEEQAKPTITGLDASKLSGAELWYYVTPRGGVTYHDFTGNSLSEYGMFKHETFTGGASSYTATDYYPQISNWWNQIDCTYSNATYRQTFYPIWVLIYEIPDP